MLPSRTWLAISTVYRFRSHRERIFGHEKVYKVCTRILSLKTTAFWGFSLSSSMFVEVQPRSNKWNGNNNNKCNNSPTTTQNDPFFNLNQFECANDDLSWGGKQQLSMINDWIEIISITFWLVATSDQIYINNSVKKFGISFRYRKKHGVEKIKNTLRDFLNSCLGLTNNTSHYLPTHSTRRHCNHLVFNHSLEI